jgi:hypothetical protein
MTGSSSPIISTGRCCGDSQGRRRNPDFLLRPSELLEAFTMLAVIAFEQGEVAVQRPAVVQPIAAIAGPLGRLPEAAG